MQVTGLYKGVIFCFIFILSFAQVLYACEKPFDVRTTLPKYEDNLLHLLINTGKSVPDTEYTSIKLDLNRFVDKLTRKRNRYHSEELFLKYVFYKIHNRYLKHYTSHANFRQTMTKGKYDCLTGTALYALVFQALGVEFVIHELPYHVYMTATMGNGKSLLLESTDGLSGYVTDPNEIEALTKKYHEDINATDINYYQYKFKIDAQVQLKELVALVYYNEAIKSYNNQDWSEARSALTIAQQLYPGKRMDTLSSLIRQIAQH